MESPGSRFATSKPQGNENENLSSKSEQKRFHSQLLSAVVERQSGHSFTAISSPLVTPTYSSPPTAL